MELAEIVEIKYTSLFIVVLTHPAYEKEYTLPDDDDADTEPELVTQSSILDSLTIKPDETTKDMFSNFLIGHTCNNNMLQCFVRSKKITIPSGEAETPYIRLGEETKFRFLIKHKNNFFSQTDIIAAGSEQVYVFSNRDNNGTDGLISKNTEVGSLDLKNVEEAIPDEKCLGVIDIYNSGTGDDYRLLGDDEEIAGRLYKIQFKRKP